MRRVESEAVRAALRVLGLAPAWALAAYAGMNVKLVRAILRSYRYEWCDKIDDFRDEGYVRHRRPDGYLQPDRWRAALWQYTALDAQGKGVLLE